MLLAGATFTGQGLRIIRGGSFMVGDPAWVVIGSVLVVAAAIALWAILWPRARR
ncbi:MAG: hypothetical protein HY071_06485 [Chloroflexi bacterium]|nr:hypothetical protein [Chloroflexota bacterium]